jgi:hypothetical protein
MQLFYVDAVEKWCERRVREQPAIEVLDQGRNLRSSAETLIKAGVRHAASLLDTINKVR